MPLKQINLTSVYSITLLLLLLAAASIIGCAHTTPSTESAATPMPEIHVVEEKSDAGQLIDAYDAATLFKRGNRLLEADRCTDAILTYRQLEEEFPNSDYVAPTLYNLGICLDKTGQYDAAVDVYHKLLQRFPHTDDLKNVRFRLADSLEALERWNDLIATLDALTEQTPDLTPVDQVEIYAKRGAALIETNQPALARIELEQAIRVFTREEGVSPTAPDFYYSMAQFKLAELTHAQMRQVELPADDKALEEILEKKCQLLLDAQYLYTQVIRIGHPHWSAAAAYSTGALYHHLWEDMLAAKPPQGLSDEERDVYMAVLHKRIKILLKKAVKQWRRTLAFATRLNLDNAWIIQTRQDLKKIEAVLEIEEQVGADLP